MDEVVHEARARMPLAHVAMENPWTADGTSPDISPGHPPQIELDGEAFATCGHHGPPVRWVP